MVVQLAMPMSFRDTLSVPITGDPPPAIFLQLELHEPCRDDTQAQTRRMGRAGCSSLLAVLIVRAEEMLDPLGEV
jgi:hypothetical protein